MTYKIIDGQIVIKATPEGNSDLLSIEVDGDDVTDEIVHSGNDHYLYLEYTGEPVKVKVRFSPKTVFADGTAIILMILALGATASVAVYLVRRD